MLASDSVVQVTLRREDKQEPWGFRLVGGCDHKKLLFVQKISIGTPSEGQLHAGDVVLAINGKDATHLTHEEAVDLISKSENTMDLTLRRDTSKYSSPGRIHHIPIQTVPPRPLSPTPDGIKQTPFISSYKPTYSPSSARPWTSHSIPVVKPVHRSGALPKATYPDKNVYWVKGQPMTQEEAEEYVEKEKERLAITHQAYRTQPIVHPSIKLKKDMPQGCYLRYYPEYSVKVTPINPGSIPESEMGHKTPDNVYTTAGAGHYSTSLEGQGLYPMETSKDGSRSVVHNLYNTPANLYSSDNFKQAYRDQIGSAPYVRSGPSPKFDPKKSPTYQAVLEDEWGDANRGREVESRIEGMQHYCNTVEKTKAYSHPVEHPHGEEQHIAQSGSFKRVMAASLGDTDL